MKTRLYLLAVVFCSAWLARAAVPPAEQMLPSDTLLFGTVPDWEKSSATWGTSPVARMWGDPAMQPFRDKLMNKIKAEAIEPLEKELGIKLADYTSLARGQVTVAIVQNGWQGESDKEPAFVLLVDTKDKADQLKQTLTDIRKRWTDSGKVMKTEKIRDHDFHTIALNNDDVAKWFQKVFPSKGDEADKREDTNKQTELTFGQADSLFLVSSSPKVIEKIVIRQGGGQVPVVAEQSGFEATQGVFRDAIGYGWANIKVFMDVVSKAVAGEKGLASGAPPGMDFKADKIFDALGLNGLRSAAFGIRQNPEGGAAEMVLGVPESNRRGLMKLVAFEPKEAGPLPFATADLTRFTRVRIDGQKFWNTLETILGDINPGIAGFVQMSVAAAGKDRDPNFDLKKMVIGNLGDDLVMLEKKPRSGSLEDIAAPPSVVLIGSGNAEQLASSLKTATSFLSAAAPGGAPADREVAGHKVYTLPTPPQPDGKAGKPMMFSAAGGYLAISQDAAILEEYLRSSENPGKPLREVTGVADAAQKVGGTGTGMFGYENQTETVRLMFEALKRDPAAFEKLFLPRNPLGPPPDEDGAKKRAEWLDFSLLPPFERIAKYFSFSVMAGSLQADGYHYKVYSPNPPGL